MDKIEAKFLLKNLLDRVSMFDENSYELSGKLTGGEFDALKMALSCLGETMLVPDVVNPALQQPSEVIVEELKSVPAFVPTEVVVNKKSEQPDNVQTDIQENIEKEDIVVNPIIELDKSVFELEVPLNDVRLCLDFGTAMSKVTLVKDATEQKNYENIEVLELGIPGDQEEISPTMLVSTVFIDGNGLLWFGKMAVERSQLEPPEENRQCLDNIKGYLSDDGFDTIVSKRFNSTSIDITYGEMILAYLMFLTWTVNKCLESHEERFPRNLNRRFAMPCLDDVKSREAEQKLRKMLGQAQILADTFYKTLQNGIPLSEFMEAYSQLNKSNFNYNFLKESITEPLGVAGSLMSWKDEVKSLVMVVDIGAGTSDFSLFRLAYNPETKKSGAVLVDNSTRGITEAGNFLDGLLRGFILKKLGVTSEHKDYFEINWDLQRKIRSYKESLFQDGSITIILGNHNQYDVDIDLDEFLELKQVKSFSSSLKNCMLNILQVINTSFIQGAPNNTLAVLLTGGGAELPMVRELASGKLNINGNLIDVVQAKTFPNWLHEDYPDLEDDYPRIAVSLGGARKRIIKSSGTAKVTAGGTVGAATLDRF